MFTVSKIQRTNSVTYKITDYNGEEIRGTFYEQELQKTSQEVFRIAKIVKKGKTRSLVQWKGYPESFNSWVDNKELIKLWCKMSNDLGIKSSTVTAFLNDKLTREQVKELQKIMNLDVKVFLVYTPCASKWSRKTYTLQNNWIKIKSPSRLPNGLMRLDPSPANKKFHLAIVSEISTGETSLDNRGVSNRQISKSGTQPINFRSL